MNENSVSRTADIIAYAGVCLLALTIVAYSYPGMPPVYHTAVPKTALMRLAALFLFSSLLVRLLLCRGFAARFAGVAWPVGLYFLWRAASLLWSGFEWASAAAIADDLFLLAVALGLIGAFSSPRLARFGAAAVGCAALAALAVFFFVGGAGKHPPFANENLGGTVFAFCGAASLGYAVKGLFGEKSKPVRAVAFPALLFALFVAGLVKVGSTGAFLGLLAGGYALLLVLIKRRTLLLTATIILAALAGTAVCALPQAGKNLLGERFKSTSWVRIYIWRGASDMYRDSPILGTGAGTFGLENVGYQPRESYLHVGIEKASSLPHSYPLAILCETGGVGLLLFLGIIVFVLNRARTAARSDARASASGGFGTAAGLVPLAALLAHGLVGISLYQPHIQVFMWAAIAMALGAGLRPAGDSPQRRVPFNAGFAARVLAAIFLSFGAAALWGEFYLWEINRELAFSRGWAALHSDEEDKPYGDIIGDFAAAGVSPYLTKHAIEADIERATALNGLGLRHLRAARTLEDMIENEPDDNARYAMRRDALPLIEAGRKSAQKCFEQSAGLFGGVNRIAPGFNDVDEKLGCALLNLSGITGDAGQRRRACLALLGFIERNPFCYSKTDTTPGSDSLRVALNALESIFRGAEDYREEMERAVKALEEARAIVSGRRDDLAQDEQFAYQGITDYFISRWKARLGGGLSQ